MSEIAVVGFFDVRVGWVVTKNGYKKYCYHVTQEMVIMLSSRIDGFIIKLPKIDRRVTNVTCVKYVSCDACISVDLVQSPPRSTWVLAALFFRTINMSFVHSSHWIDAVNHNIFLFTRRGGEHKSTFFVKLLSTHSVALLGNLLNVSCSL